ncbi:toxin-antitoxin system YwqK family antitoxin [Adhaeribacter terreus]|uniref:Toxin-antitoxin system YwqK family antitoxin n=1 Tax=Adhaeribacter terreus TaxID=529703 RepID=A0ABW0EAW2_9BACT
MRLVFLNKIIPFFFLVLTFACSQRNYNVDMKPKPEVKNGVPPTGAKPDTLVKSTPQDSVRQAAEAAALAGAKTTVKEEKQTKKKKKKVFLGYRIKKGVARSGSGKGAVTEVFHYLRTYKEPSAYAPAKYYYNVRRRKIFKGRTIDPKVSKILHGHYKKLQNGKVLEEGYFYVGTKHLRWEKYNRDGLLLGKTHFEKGFPRDAQITYYDAAQQKVKEVIPYMNGEVEGDYVKFRPDGLLEREGQYEKGKKVGSWIEFWPFRNRKRYEYKYPESAYDEPFEPYLYREWNKNNSLIYQKGKLDKRDQQK